VSATGRGPRLGGPEDYYATPAFCVDRLLEAVDLPGGRWVEPGAGNGSIIAAVNARRDDVDWVAIELRAKERSRLSRLTGGQVVTANFLTHTFVGTDAVTVVIGNPPYGLALEFIGRSLALFPQATVAFLLRLNFAASGGRAAFMRRCPPDIYVLPNRPSFRNGKTDATEYCWMVWPPGNRTRGTFQVLATTDKAGRTAKP
jgi:hypothetical protein